MSETISSPVDRPIDKIAAALAKAQAKFEMPERNKTVTVRSDKGNYTFDYADYHAIAESVRGPLSENGIAFIHFVEPTKTGTIILITRLIHSSGQFLESVWPLPNTPDPKMLGGAMTYGKRYSLSALTGCVADDDLDADAENTTSFASRAPTKPPVKPLAVRSPVENDLPIETKPAPIKIKTGAGPEAPAEEAPAKGPSAAQLKMLWASMADKAWEKEQVKEYIYNRWHVDSSLDLTRGEISTLIDILKNKTYAQAAEDLLAFQK